MFGGLRSLQRATDDAVEDSTGGDARSSAYRAPAGAYITISDGEGLKLALQRRATDTVEPYYVRLQSHTTVEGQLHLEDQSAVIDCRSNILDIRSAVVLSRAESFQFFDCALYTSTAPSHDQPTHQRDTDVQDGVQLWPLLAHNQTFFNSRIIRPCEVRVTPLLSRTSQPVHAAVTRNHQSQ